MAGRVGGGGGLRAVSYLIEIVATTGSTNADLAARLNAGERLAEGDWLIADRQHAGRGRLGREWSDGSDHVRGSGNFMGSTTARLTPHDPSPGTLALAAGLAVYEAAAPLLPPPHRAMLKWPNDVLVAGAKLAGILLERVGDRVIIGIGVNLAATPNIAGRATISLAHFGPAPGRDGFAETLAAAFAEELHRWRTYGLAPLIARWHAAGHSIGTPLTVGEPGEAQLTGNFAGLSEDGALRLALPDGTERSIHAGEVNLG